MGQKMQPRAGRTRIASGLPPVGPVASCGAYFPICFSYFLFIFLFFTFFLPNAAKNRSRAAMVRCRGELAAVVSLLPWSER
jgi:hypothetical protein